MSKNYQEINPEELKREVKQELLKQEILCGLEEDEIDLFELAKVLYKHWKLVIVFPFVVAVLVALYSLTLPNHFKASTTVFVHSSGGKMSSLLSSIPLAGMLGGIGGNSSSDYLMAYLKSRTLSEKIIARFGIATNPAIVGESLPDEPPKFDDVLKKLNSIVSISKDKEGMITISAETLVPEVSAEIAESYVGYLQSFAKGPQKQKRVFVEMQLQKVTKELEEAELALKSFQDKHKLFALEQQTSKMISKLAELEGEKIRSGIQVKMQESLLKASGNMPELVKLEGQKVSEEAKLKALDEKITEAEAGLKELPDIALQFVRLKREEKIKEKIFGLLTEQFEMAKIAEAEEGSQFEVIDHARAPERKSKPRRSIMVILAGLAAGVLGVFGAFGIEFVNRKKQELKQKEQEA
jgi:uncharacterized protein involved in exopolysaccharide biosynthesis